MSQASASARRSGSAFQTLFQRRDLQKYTDGMPNTTHAVRISATLSAELANFLDEYQTAYALESRSAALARAVTALRDQELHIAYQELGDAQRAGLEIYPPDNTDGLDGA
jgi:hypothetical protein